jgi:hypothetical protein
VKRSKEEGNEATAGSEQEPARCPITACVYHEDCEVVRILGRAPKAGGKCSYLIKDRGGRKKSNSGGDSEL